MMGLHSQIINMVVVDSVLVYAKRLKRNTFASRNKITEYGILKLTIVYVCATGSIPIALSLIIKALSPGTALALLMAGPAANR